MRTIKFRIWNTKQKCFYTEDHIKANFFNFIDKMPDQPIMQFTGLLDRHGKEIFEGDVIACKESKGFQHRDTFFLGVSNFGDIGWVWTTSKNLLTLSDRIDERYEIIGNIYEKPELLNHDL